MHGNYSKTNTMKLTRLSIFDRVATFCRVMGMRGDFSIASDDKYELQLILLKMINTVLEEK